MGRVLSFIILFFVVSQNLWGQSYSELTWNQRSYLDEIFQRIYVIGGYDPETNSLYGLKHHQRQSLEKAYAEFKQGEASFKERLHEAFQFQQSLVDWAYLYQRQVAENPALRHSLYEAAAKQLRPEVERSFENIRSVLQLELQTKQYELRYPLFASAQIFPGWSKLDIEIYFEILAPDALRQLDRGLIRRLFEKQPLSFEQFANYWQALGQSQNLEQRYQLYLDLGSYLPSDRELPVDLKEREFYLGLIQASNAAGPIPWETTWIWDSESLEQINAVLWLDQNYGHRWPELQDLKARYRQADVENFFHDSEELGLSIDQMLVELSDFSEDEVEIFELVSIELENAQVSALYFELSTELRNILVAKYFPRFSIRAGRALLEGRLLELDELELASVLNLTSTQAFAGSLNLKDPTAQDKLHEHILQAHLQTRQDPLRLEELVQNQQQQELLYGKSLPDVAYAKAKMRAEIESNPSLIDGGWIPDFLIESILVHLFPYEGYLEDEVYRLVNELERRDEIRSRIQRMEQLSQKTGVDIERLLELEQKRMRELLYTVQGLPKTDLSSPAVYFASFLDGAVQNPESAVLSAGAGFLFYVVLKGAGGKIVLSFIALDTGLHFWTSAYIEEGNYAWHELPLENGISSPLRVGKITAQSLQELYHLAQAILSPTSPTQRLEGFSQLGAMSWDLFWFGAGTRIAKMSLPTQQLQFYRKSHKLTRKFRELDRKIQWNRKEITVLESELKKLNQQISESSTRRPDLLQQRILLEQRIQQLQVGLQTSLSGPIGFYFKQGVRLLGRGLETIYLFNPFRRGQLSRRSFKQRLSDTRRFWTRSRQFGIRQYELRMAQIQAKVGRMEERMVFGKRRRGFDSEFRRAQSALDRLNSELRILEGGVSKSELGTIGKRVRTELRQSVLALEKILNDLLNFPKARVGLKNTSFRLQLTELQNLRIMSASMRSHLRLLESSLKQNPFVLPEGLRAQITGLQRRAQALDNEVFRLSNRLRHSKSHTQPDDWLRSIAQNQRSPQRPVFRKWDIDQLLNHSQAQNKALPSQLSHWSKAEARFIKYEGLEVYVIQESPVSYRLFVGDSLGGRWRLIEQIKIQ